MGTSRSDKQNCRGKRDHPHACGDKSSFIEKIVTTMGSSPRVWGQGLDCLLVILLIGIIPTRVGTRLNAIRNSASQKDHPHACGDKKRFCNHGKAFVGSSPRVWGQETVIQISQKGCRIIPTRVGTRTIGKLCTVI